MIAKATDQKAVETSGVSEESVDQKNDFTAAQCERFYQALVMKMLMAQDGCKCEMAVKIAKNLPPNAKIEPYYDAEREVVGIRVHAEPKKKKRGKIKIARNTGLIGLDGKKLTD